MNMVEEKAYADRFNWTQPILGAVILLAMLFWGNHLKVTNVALPMQLFIGVLMGIVLVRGRFGFAGGVKRIFVRGEGSLSKALLLMLSVTMVLFMSYQWMAAQNGAVPAYLAEEGQAIIPGTQNVFPVNISLIIGGFLFGFGMIISGGCASGTLTDFGEGEGRSFVTLIFFILSTIPGEWARYTLDNTAIGQIGFRTYLPKHFGYFGALLISMILVAITYWIVISYEAKRKKNGTYLDPKGDWEDDEKPLDEAEEYSFFSFHTYHKLFIERLSFKTTGLLLAALASFVLLFTGKAWGVTSAFSQTAVWGFTKLGVNFQTPVFQDLQAATADGLFTSGGIVRNTGLVFGAMITLLFANNFKFHYKMNTTDLAYYAFGGILLGFGARLAKGCNAGALYSSMATFSLSGWVFLIAMTLGAIACLKLLAGKMSMVPNRCEIFGKDI